MFNSTIVFMNIYVSTKKSSYFSQLKINVVNRKFHSAIQWQIGSLKNQMETFDKHNPSVCK